MGNSGTIRLRAMPTAKAVPQRAQALRAEVLLTLRKRGSTREASRPSRGHAERDCLGRGYDLIHQVSPAPGLKYEAKR